MFVHWELDKEIDIIQPPRFKVTGKEDIICKLEKTLYGLKQSP